MSQLGQFAQLSYLLSQQPADQAFENFKKDKSLIKQLEDNNLNAENFMSQLSQFGYDPNKRQFQTTQNDLDIGELSDLKSSSIMRAKSPLQKSSIGSAENKYQKIMQKLTNSISNDVPKDKEF